MAAFDPRVTPARPDLAARYLEGRVDAERFVEGRAFEIVEPMAPLRSAPRPDAPLLTEALKGERVTIYDTDGEGWAWGQLDADGYVGWMPESGLGRAGASATHKVAALRTLVFPGPSTGCRPSRGCRSAPRSRSRASRIVWAVTPTGYVPAAHLRPIDEFESDFVAVAERFTGAPYLWGGKTVLGLDCSGLVQVALTACGIACPRDSDMQEAALGAPVAPAPDYDNLQRGDLLFWMGHVAIVRGRDSLIHANAFHMAVAIEPVAQAIARIREAGIETTGVRRIRG